MLVGCLYRLGLDMEVCGDFIQYLNKDTSMKILMSLDDPFDLARVGAVSTSWRQFGKWSVGG